MPDGEVNYVEPRALGVLLRLAEFPGHLVSRRQLLDEFWFPNSDCDSALTRAVSILRRQLGDTERPPQFIHTIHKRGYRLLKPVQRVPEGADLAPTAAVDVNASVAPLTARPKDYEKSTSFLHELKRRCVFRVASAYAIVGWLIMQVGETTFTPLGVPDWILTVLMLLVILGFPMAIVLAWAVQLTPKGPVLEMPVAKFNDVKSRIARTRFRYLLIGLVAGVSVFMAFTFAGSYDNTASPAMECSLEDSRLASTYAGNAENKLRETVTPETGNTIAFLIGGEL